MIDKFFRDPRVAATKLGTASYPAEVPFHPSVAYPECAGDALGTDNQVYDAVRRLLHILRLDDGAYGSARWNPLGEIVRPGDTVVVKPNLIAEGHKLYPAQWEQVITHGSVIRAITDYVLIALEGRGCVWIADGPQLDSDWEAIIARTGIAAVCAYYERTAPVPVRLLDLRDSFVDRRGDVRYGERPLPGDPDGSVEVDLGDRSRLEGYGGAGRYFGADYDRSETNRHHTSGRHEYRLCATPLRADVLISLPKLKTHKKVGVTLSMKNLVGTNSGRNWLPHYTEGDPSQGGDQFPVPSFKNRSERLAIRSLQRATLRHPRAAAPLFRAAKRLATPLYGHTHDTIRSGNWYGNDTCWRMVHDINRCLLYWSPDGFPSTEPKRFFSLVDGVVGGERGGPEAPDPVASGVLVAGFNALAVDCAAARLMGFDPRLLPVLSEGFRALPLPLAPFAYEDIELVSDSPVWSAGLVELPSSACFSFSPPFSWKGHMEWAPDNRGGA